MRVVLHCGQPKTGSTALQSALNTGRAALEQVGVLYPKPERGSIHNSLLCLPLDDSRFPSLVADWDGGVDQAKASGRRVLDETISRCKAGDIDCVILSSELVATHFFAPKDHAALQSQLATISENIEPIIYVREPAAHYLSYLQESLKSNTKLRRLQPLSIQPIFDSIQAAFRGRTTLCAYDRGQLHQGDIIEDFLTRTVPGRLAAGTLKARNENITLSAEGMVVLKQVREIFATGRDGKKEIFTLRFIPAIRRAEVELSIAKPKLKPEIEAGIRRASIDLLWLRDEIGVSFPEVDYNAIDGTPLPEEWADLKLDDIVQIDPEKCDALANTVSESLIKDALGFLNS